MNMFQKKKIAYINIWCEIFSLATINDVIRYIKVTLKIIDSQRSFAGNILNFATTFVSADGLALFVCWHPDITWYMLIHIY